MTIACIDLYNNLLDHIDKLIESHHLTLSQGEVIRAELRDAMYHSGGPDNTRKCLCALAFHYDFPVPPGAEISPDDLPFDIPVKEVVKPHLCWGCGGVVGGDGLGCVCNRKPYYIGGGI